MLLGTPGATAPLVTVTEELVTKADRHWVAPLLAHVVTARGASVAVTPSAARQLRHQLCYEASIEAVTRGEVMRLLDACAERGVTVLLVKGAALAYTHYPAPYLRPRLDTDVLVRREDRRLVADVLRSLDYREAQAVTGTQISQQMQYWRQLNAGVRHAFDVHWQIVNPHVFSDLLTFEELDATADALPALGSHARTPNPVHALLVSALHQLAHHERELDLLWLYDVHRISEALTDTQWRHAIALADDRRLSTVCANLVRTAHDLFATALPPAAVSWIAAQRATLLPPEFRSFGRPGRRILDVFLSDFISTRNWRARTRLLREHLLPPRSYMRALYQTEQTWAIPALYLHRILTGCPRWFRRGLYR
jgi:hypothetical protein